MKEELMKNSKILLEYTKEMEKLRIRISTLEVCKKIHHIKLFEKLVYNRGKIK